MALRDRVLSIVPKPLDNLFGIQRRSSVPPRATVGGIGTVIHGGFVQPIDQNTLLGSDKFRSYAEVMSNTSIIAASIRYYLNLLADAEWSVEPADDTPQARQMAELMEEIMTDMDTPWARVVRRGGMFRFLGFSIQEWTAKKRDEEGVLGLRDISGRPQFTIERWDMLDNGDVQGVVQRSPQTGEDIYIPRSKLVYVVDDSITDSPEGLGLLRHVMPAVKRLERYEQLEMFGYETDMRGVPVARAPLAELNSMVESNKITPEARTQVLNILDGFIRNHIKGPNNGILIDSSVYRDGGQNQAPSGTPKYAIDLLDANIQGQDDIHQAIVRINMEIARILGTEQLLLGADSKGSHALSTDKTQALHQMVNSSLGELAETHDRDTVGTIWKLNGFDPELKPRLVPETVRYRNIEQMAQTLSDMSSAGVVLDREDEAIQEMFQLLGLTPPQGDLDEEELRDERPGDTDDTDGTSERIEETTE